MRKRSCFLIASIYWNDLKCVRRRRRRRRPSSSSSSSSSVPIEFPRKYISFFNV